MNLFYKQNKFSSENYIFLISIFEGAIKNRRMRGEKIDFIPVDLSTWRNKIKK